MGRLSYAGGVLLALLVLQLALPRGAGAGSLEEEALRQLEFSRTELAAGSFEKAVSSAESALRLQPTLYEALALKALAYEGLGKLDLAESLLIAYLELAGGTQLLTDAVDALDRVKTARREAWSSGGAGGPPRPPSDSTARRDPTRPVAASRAPLDTGPYRTRVLEALRAGQCASARAAATELTTAAPEGADGYRLLGDAARCSGAAREALIAYRKYVSLGGPPGEVQTLIGALREQLGRLVVEVDLPEGAPVAQVRLRTTREHLVPTQESSGAFVFEDLSTGEASVLQVTGRGLEPLTEDIQPLSSGENRWVELTPTFIGLAVVRVGAYPADRCEVSVGSPDGWEKVGPGGEARVTASGVVVTVVNTNGSVEVPVEVEPGGMSVFDPAPWIPAELTLVGVPTRSTLLLGIQGSDGASLDREVKVPATVGELDAETGVLLTPPLQLTSLIGGQARIQVSHPTLGEGASTAVLAAGTVNASTFDWSSMPGVPGVQAGYEAWLRESGALDQKTTSPRNVSIGVMVGGLVATGVLWGASVAQAAQTSRALDELRAGQDGGLDDNTVQTLQMVYDDAVPIRNGLFGAAAAASAVGATGIILTVAFGARAQKAKVSQVGWEPANLPGVGAD